MPPTIAQPFSRRVNFFGLYILALSAQCSGAKKEVAQISTPPKQLSQPSSSLLDDDSNTSSNSSILTSIDWSKEVIVISSPRSVTMKMGESTDLRLVVSAACLSDDVKHSFRMESSSTHVAYLSTKQKTNFILSCKSSRPAAEALETISNFYHQRFFNNDDKVNRSEENARTGVKQSESGDVPPSYHVGLQSHDSDDVRKNRDATMTERLPRVTLEVNVTISADLLGRSWLLITSRRDTPVSFDHHGHRDTSIEKRELHSNTTSGSERSSTFGDVVVHEVPIVVLRSIRPIDVIFRGVLFFFVACASVGMGCKTDLAVVKQVLRLPVAPIMGFVGQYIGMPLVAFAMAKSFSFENPAVSLGIFTCGVCPGGGASNIFTYLLKGDLSLSVTMTCVSSVFAMAMIPLWMFTLGPQFNDDKISIRVPYLKILQSLAIVVVPLLVGFTINIKLPKIAVKIQKIVKPLSILTIVFILTVGVYSNFYMFRLMKPNTVLAACLLPYIGYILGESLAFISRQPWPRVVTIAIETGIQNTTVAYLMLTFSLPQPDSDLAAVGSMTSAMMTPLPLLVISCVYIVYLRCVKKDTPDKGDLKGKGRGNGDDEDEELVQMNKGSSKA